MRPRFSFSAILAPFSAALFLGGCDIDVASASGDAPPYWSSLRYNQSNMRVGPGRTYPIEWEYLRVGLPVKVLRVREGWELVEDPDGARGWFSTSQLSRRRTAMVTGDRPAALRDEPQAAGAVLWRAQPGVIGALERCEGEWCEIEIKGRRGWLPADRLWGDEEPSAPQ